MQSEGIKKQEMIEFDLPETFDIPQAFKDFPLSSFSLSVRLTNVLDNLGFRQLGDLHEMSVAEFKATRHCGEKTVREIVSLIEKIREAETVEDFTGLDVIITPAELTLPQFIELVDKFWAEQKPMTGEILVGRFGGESEKTKTLEELAVERGLSRERIRQIATLALDNLEKLLGDAGKKLFDQIYQACIEAICPLTPQLVLAWLGKDASDFRFPIPFYVRILAEFAPQIPILPEGSFLQGKPSEPRAYKIYRQTRMILARRSQPMPLKDVFETLKESAELKDLEREEFLKVFRYSKDFTLSFDVPDEPVIKLTAKLKVYELAYIVLSESDRALHPDEIIERAKKIFGEAEVTVTPGALLQLPEHKRDFYLLDRRTIGLRHHLSFPRSEWDSARNDVFKLLKKYHRSFSTKEIISDKLFGWTDKISAGELAQIMREDPRFVDLGRLNFVLRGWNIRKREKIADLIIRTLREADHPLMPIEMKQEIQKRRTVNESGLSPIIRQHPLIRKYDYGFYGLKEWGDEKMEYLLTNETFVYRILIMSETPLRFGDMCKRLGIEKNQMWVKILWERLQTMPKTELSPNRKAPDTLVLYNSFGKMRYRKKNP